MKKTFIVYGLFGLVVALQLLPFVGVGIQKVSHYISYILPINLALLFLATVLDPFGLFCLVLAYFPFYRMGLRFEIGIITFNPYTIGMIALTVVAIFQKIFREAAYQLNATDRSLGILCGTFLVTTILSPDVISTGRLAFTSIFIPVITYFLTRIMIQDAEKYKMALNLVIVTSTIFAAAAILSLIRSGQRATPFGVPPIGAATILVFPIFYLVLTDRLRSPLGVVAIGINLLGLAATFSRVVFLVLLLSPLVWSIVKRSKVVVLYGSFFALTLFMTISFVMCPSVLKPNKLSQTKGPEVSKSIHRLTDFDHWKKALYGRALSYREGMVSLKEKPIFGIGIQRGEANITQHNFHVEWLEYGGLIGYVSYLLVFLTHVKRMELCAQRDPYIRINLLVLFAVLCNSLFNGIIHGTMPHIAFITMALSEARLNFAKEYVTKSNVA